MIRALLFLALLLSTVVPARGDSPEFRVAFGSCVKTPKSIIWSSIRSKKPDVFLFLGDNIYQTPSDFGQALRIRALYQALLSQPDIMELKRTARVVAVWDDHDFEDDNADSTAPGAAVSLREFRLAWPDNPSPPPGLEASVASELTEDGVRILLLDSRTYRRNPGGAERPILFGSAQLEWIDSALRNPNARVVILASGTPWLARGAKIGGPAESVTQYPEEEARIHAAVAASPVPVVLISGDRHYAEAIKTRIGTKEVFEISASPLSAPPEDSRKVLPESGRLFSAVGPQNFAVVTIGAGEQPSINAEFFGADGKTLFRTEIR